MDDTHRTSGRFWILVPEEDSSPDAPPPEPEIVAPSPRSLAVERWIGIATIVAMIGLSDVLMVCYWH